MLACVARRLGHLTIPGAHGGVSCAQSNPRKHDRSTLTSFNNVHMGHAHCWTLAFGSDSMPSPSDCSKRGNVVSSVHHRAVSSTSLAPRPTGSVTFTYPVDPGRN